MEQTISDIKKKYEAVENKYSLPKFEKISEDFDMEKLAEKESLFLLKDVRKIIAEKIASYSQFFENLRNPMSLPMFVLAPLKNANEEDKKTIKEVYKELSKMQLHIIKLDLIYNEEKEAQFIKQTYDKWQTIKVRIHKLIEKFESEVKENSEQANRNYFG